MRRRCARESRVVQIAHEILNSGSKVVWMVTAACGSRGHRKTPTKAIFRGLGRFIPTIAGWEWGSSSRCPRCKTAERNIQAMKPTNRPALTTQQESYCEASMDGVDAVYSEENEERRDQCTDCKTVWGHDELGTLNQRHIFTAMLLHQERPVWLTPPRT